MHFFFGADWPPLNFTAIAAFLGTLLGTVAAWRASWKALAEMYRTERDEFKRKYEASERENGVLRRDYRQTLEFNMQDRETKDLMADEIMRLCLMAKEDAAQVLHRIRLDVLASANRRRLLEDIHGTASGGAGEGER